MVAPPPVAAGQVPRQLSGSGTLPRTVTIAVLETVRIHPYSYLYAVDLRQTSQSNQGVGKFRKQKISGPFSSP